MAEASRRAARQAGKGGLENALFAVGAAASAPVELGGVAGLVTVTFPWGSLLRGCLGKDRAASAGIRSLVARGGELAMVLAPADRDRLGDVPTARAAVIAAAGATFEALGLTLVEGRPMAAEELRESRSSWARRLLRDGGDREATLVRFRSP